MESFQLSAKTFLRSIKQIKEHQHVHVCWAEATSINCIYKKKKADAEIHKNSTVVINDTGYPV